MASVENPYIGLNNNERVGNIYCMSDINENVFLYYNTSNANRPGRNWTLVHATVWTGQGLAGLPMDNDGSYNPRFLGCHVRYNMIAVNMDGNCDG